MNVTSNMILMAERMGFEPTIGVTTYNGLANRRLQPLGHLSIHQSESFLFRVSFTIFGFFVGQVMKESKGKANPQLVNQVLKDLLSK